MATIAQPCCHCNNENPGFSGFSETATAPAPYWPGRRALSAVRQTQLPATDRGLSAGCRQLLDAIRTRLPYGQDSAALRQQELAEALQVTAVTVRRRTVQLQQQGLLLVRRTRNRLVYTIPTTPTRPEPTPPEPPAAPAPTPTAAAPPPAGGPTPCCPKHRLTRRSWMSKLFSAALHFCPARTGINTFCSWLHHNTLGQLQPPEQTELDYDAVCALLEAPVRYAATGPQEPKAEPTPVPAPASAAATGPQEPKAEPTPVPAPAPAPDSPAQQVWHMATDALQRQTPDDIRPYLAASRATGYDGRTLSVATATPAVLRWFRTSFTASAIPQALAQALGHPAAIRYHCAEAPS